MRNISLLTLLAFLVAEPSAVFAQSANPSGGANNAATSTNNSRTRPVSPGLTPVYNPSANAPVTGGNNNNNSAINNLDLPATDPSYQLSNGDEVAIIIWGESDVSTDQRIDSKGIVRMPLIGEVNLSSKTVREAEKYLEKVFVDKKILRKPMVTISVRDYAAREVAVLGAVVSPGKYRMPKEAGSIEIVELITSLGGFKPAAKSDEVKVTRVDEAGIETVSTVNVESMITGRGASKNSPKSFLIYAGDRIYVPERIF
jgi:polysaccharide export outer membrane protein